MPLDRQEWHHRYQIQAQWTEGLRLYFFDLIKDDAIHSILDIGCGTGALLPDLQALSPAGIFGADINQDHLQLAKKYCPHCSLCSADVHQLPYADGSFDVVLCHFFLMWTGNPSHAMEEMIRVAKPGGTVVAFAEPDYGGRIDYPPAFEFIRECQISSLEEAGADPLLGRKLASLFPSSDFAEVECGVYQGLFAGQLSREQFESEWKVLADDLAGRFSKARLAELRERELSARKAGTRLIFIPTFYAWGKVLKNT